MAGTTICFGCRREIAPGAKRHACGKASAPRTNPVPKSSAEMELELIRSAGMAWGGYDPVTGWKKKGAPS
jgi:hypothetical protein